MEILEQHHQSFVRDDGVLDGLKTKLANAKSKTALLKKDRDFAADELSRLTTAHRTAKAELDNHVASKNPSIVFVEAHRAYRTSIEKLNALFTEMSGIEYDLERLASEKLDLRDRRELAGLELAAINQDEGASTSTKVNAELVVKNLQAQDIEKDEEISRLETRYQLLIREHDPISLTRAITDQEQDVASAIAKLNREDSQVKKMLDTMSEFETALLNKSKATRAVREHTTLLRNSERRTDPIYAQHKNAYDTSVAADRTYNRAVTAFESVALEYKNYRATRQDVERAEAARKDAFAKKKEANKTLADIEKTIKGRERDDQKMLKQLKVLQNDEAKAIEAVSVTLKKLDESVNALELSAGADASKHKSDTDFIRTRANDAKKAMDAAASSLEAVDKRLGGAQSEVAEFERAIAGDANVVLPAYYRQLGTVVSALKTIYSGHEVERSSMDRLIIQVEALLERGDHQGQAVSHGMLAFWRPFGERHGASSCSCPRR